MFDLFSWQHIILLLVVALVVVGPKDLPRLMNMMGRWAGKARDMANEFRRSFDEMARQAELDELRKEIDELKKNNPVSGISDAMNEMKSQIDQPVTLDEAAPAEVPAPEPLAHEPEMTAEAEAPLPAAEAAAPARTAVS